MSRPIPLNLTEVLDREISELLAPRQFCYLNLTLTRQLSVTCVAIAPLYQKQLNN